MKHCHLPVIVLLTVLVAGCGLKSSNETAPTKPPQAKKEIAAPKPPPLDRIKVDVKRKRIEIEGRFCLKEGILDYLAVASGGQEYESVVALNCKGSLIHEGLLALGAVPAPTEEVLEYLRKNPPKDMEIPDRAGTALNLTFEWKKDGKAFSASALHTLFNRKDKKIQDTGEWIFTGSYFAKDLDDGKTEFYMADVDRALIGVFYTGSAVINFSKDIGNPYAGEDQGYEVNAKLVPPKGTPVKLIITLAEPQKKN